MLTKFKRKFQKQLNQFADFYFGDKPKPKSKIDIVVGDIFIYRDIGREEEKDPFKRAKRSKDTIEVKVLAIQEGYIQYKTIGLKHIDSTDSISMDIFLDIYRKK